MIGSKCGFSRSDSWDAFNESFGDCPCYKNKQVLHTTSGLTILTYLWQQNPCGTRLRECGSRRPSSGPTGSTLSFGRISSGIARATCATRGWSWRPSCAIGSTPTTRAGPRSPNTTRSSQAGPEVAIRIVSAAIGRRGCRSDIQGVQDG